MAAAEGKYDCIVVGGGPGGATAAALLAQYGHKVLLLERGQHPRFHVGESLMPESYWVFKRLGMLEKLNASRFVRKHSVQFVSASGRESKPFYFQDINPHESSVTWQVVRSEFDAMMLETAREKGATIWQEANVTDVVMEPTNTDDMPRARGVVVSREDRPSQRIDAKVIIDATGTSCLLSRRLGLRIPDPMLKKASIFAHYQGGHRDAGRDEGATLLVSTTARDGWLWYIPLNDDIVSVGLVGDLDRVICGRITTPEETLEEEIGNCPKLHERLLEAQRVSPAKVLSDFSYRASRCAGEGWALVGDAFGFLDPIYSSGIFLAMKSAELAADVIHEGLVNGDLSARQLSKWGETFCHGLAAIRKLVYAFYSKGFSFGRFVRENPQFKKHLVDMLIGNVFNSDAHEIFAAMGESVTLPEPIPLHVPPAKEGPTGSGRAS